jgi:hypothetical protein
MAKPWANVVVLLGMAASVVVGASRRSPALVNQASASSQRIESLENRAANQPGDVVAVQALVKTYLDQGAPGQAVAVLHRAPAAAFASPAASDLAATAYLNAGLGSASLSMTRRVLELCSEQRCDASLVARSVRREGVLEAVIEMGIEDVTSNPEAAQLAYRRTVRQVRVAMN